VNPYTLLLEGCLASTGKIEIQLKNPINFACPHLGDGAIKTDNDGEAECCILL